jgi:hypothetical protein
LPCGPSTSLRAREPVLEGTLPRVPTAKRKKTEALIVEWWLGNGLATSY